MREIVVVTRRVDCCGSITLSFRCHVRNPICLPEDRWMSPGVLDTLGSEELVNSITEHGTVPTGQGDRLKVVPWARINEQDQTTRL